MSLYIIRHGQTAWNAEWRLQGQKDIPLNDLGRQQAAENGIALAASRPTSRLPLRLQPARTGARDDGNPPPLRRRRSPRLRHRRPLKEICFGDWEGRTSQKFPSTPLTG